jgi:hypothetical protein
MKPLYPTLFSLLALGAQAQLELPQHPEHRDGFRIPAVLMPTNPDRGSAFYSESFDTSLNGWTVVTTQGAVNWKWTSTGPGPTPSTYPVPVLNSSTPSGWAIIDDDFDGVAGASTNSSLVSPVIDLSGTPPNLKLEFEQYFQEFQQDRTFVGVSTNGGATWNEIEINIGVGRDGRPNPELVDVNISSWVAANPANVQLRFRYESTWDYGWQVDNISIVELPANDMAIVRANNTDFDFANTEFDNMDYSIYPLSQVTPLRPNATIRNKGFLQQTGVRMNFQVDGPGGNEVNALTNPSVFAPAQEAGVTLPEFTPSGALGDYILNYTVTQDATDDVPSNNSITSRIAVSTNIFAHDDGAVTNFQRQGPDTENEAFEVGNYFVLSQASYLTAIQVAVHEDTPVGGSIYGAIYLPAASNTVHPDLLELTGSYTITAGDLNPLGGSNFITLPFSTPVQLDANQPYFVVGGSFDGPDNIHFATSGISAEQVSNIHYPGLSTGFQFFITKTPMVRMVISDQVGVEELVGNGLSLGANQPNPFSDRTAIPFTLDAPATTSLMITDITGKVVLTKDLGTRAAGQHLIHFDGDLLPPGVYTYTLNTGTERLTRRMVVAR